MNILTNPVSIFTIIILEESVDTGGLGWAAFCNHRRRWLCFRPPGSWRDDSAWDPDFLSIFLANRVLKEKVLPQQIMGLLVLVVGLGIIAGPALPQNGDTA